MEGGGLGVEARWVSLRATFLNGAQSNAVKRRRRHPSLYPQRSTLYPLPCYFFGHAATIAAPIFPSVTWPSLSTTHLMSVFCFVNPQATTRD